MKVYFLILTNLILGLMIFGSNVSAINVGLIRNSTWGENLTGERHSSLVFGDLDNDGDLDLIVAGCSVGGVDTCTTADKVKVYINNRTTFLESPTWEQNLASIGYGSLALGDLDNDGDLDLIVAGDTGGVNGAVRIYLNSGVSLIENQAWQQNLSVVDSFAGTVALGDVNNDGRLDLALLGAFPASDNGIYINNETALVKDSKWLELPYVGHGYGLGVAAWGDVDNDGDLDLVFSGSYSTNFYDNVFINNGTQLIENSIWREDFRMLGWSSLTLGDYDNDADLDLAYMGTHGGDDFYTYHNDGTKFVEDSLIYGYFDGSVAWGDYDNDGDLDLVAMGKESGRNRIYNNNGGSFLENAAGDDFRIDDMQQGSLAWGDIDGDGNLDLVCSGYKYNNGYLTKIYISNSTTSNSLPIAPNGNFNNNYDESEISLSWGGGSDIETPDLGLYYNLRVGTCSKCHNIVSGVYGGSSNPTAGYFGNMMQRKSITLNKYFTPGTILYWSVQTIDTGLTKSEWSIEQEYTIPVTSPPILLNMRNGTVNWRSAVILFDTDIQGNTTVHYGVDQSNLSFISSDSTLTLNHSVVLIDLENNTTYHYNITSCNSNGCNTSETYNFTTSVCIPSWSCSSWRSCQPGNIKSCNSWSDANDCGESYSGTNTRSCTYSSGRTSRPSYTPPKTYTFDSIDPGIPVTEEITEGMNITIEVKNTLKNVDLVVSAMVEKPKEVAESANGKVYQYIQINSSGIEYDEIEEASIEFMVSKEWINQNNIDKDSITMYRYHDNNWQDLETVFSSDENDNYLYSAKIPGFSYFAITGEENSMIQVCNSNSICQVEIGENEENCPDDCVPVPDQLCTPNSKRCSDDKLQECNPTGMTWIAKEDCINGCDSATLACNPPPAGDTSWYYIIISIMVVAIVAVVYFMNKKPKKPKTLEEALEGMPD